MLVMADWRRIGAARCPDIPQEEIERIAAVLEILESRFAPLAAALPLEADPAVAFLAAPEVGE
jgi:hypothetical protein